MSSKDPKSSFQQKVEEIIREILGTGVDPLTLERLHTDLMLRYLCPTQESGPVSAAHAQDVIYNGEIIMRLLRGLGDSREA